MNITEATERACEEPTMIDAIAHICVWETERIVKQAANNNGYYETCFRLCITSTMKLWLEKAK